MVQGAQELTDGQQKHAKGAEKFRPFSFLILNRCLMFRLMFARIGRFDMS